LLDTRFPEVARVLVRLRVHCPSHCELEITLAIHSVASHLAEVVTTLKSTTGNPPTPSGDASTNRDLGGQSLGIPPVNIHRTCNRVYLICSSTKTCIAAIKASTSTPRGIVALLKHAIVGNSPWLKAPNVAFVLFISLSYFLFLAQDRAFYAFRMVGHHHRLLPKVCLNVFLLLQQNIHRWVYGPSAEVIPPI
jgi:hypothetical protein